MALSFLRHLKPETRKSHKKFLATQTFPQPNPVTPGRLKGEEEEPHNNPISSQYITDVSGKRAEEEESGICTDTSSERSRRGSNEGQEETDLRGSTIGNLDDWRAFADVPVEVHTGFSGRQSSEAASDLGASELSAGAEEEKRSQNEIRSGYVDTDAESSSVEHLSGNMQQHTESAEHHPLEPVQHFDNFYCSSPASIPRIGLSEELEPEMSTFPSSAHQDGDDAADETESNLSNTSRQDSMTEPDAIGNSHSSRRLSNSASMHSQDSSDISANTITEFSTDPLVLPPPPPPPPLPIPGLFLPGDHTTSSTTDFFQPTPVSTRKANVDEEDELMRQIQAAARNMSNQRGKLSSFDQGFPKAKPTQFSETFSSDLKSVIANRQSRIGAIPMDGGGSEIPGKITFYKDRIGIPPEDTELCRVFLKRAAKATPPENGHSSAVSQESRSTGSRALAFMTSDSRKDSAEESKQIEVPNARERNLDVSVADEISEHSAAEATADCALGTYEDTADTQVNESDNFPCEEQNSDVDQDLPIESSSYHASTPSRELEEKEFHDVVEDFDQFLEENISAESLQDLSETSVPLHGQIRGFSVIAQRDSNAESRIEDIESTTPTYTNGMSEDSGCFSPNLSFSEAESPVFEEMDEAAISTSAKTVQERSKLLAQPLESYNILPTVKETSTRTELKSKFSFRNIMTSLRHTFGRRKRENVKESRRFSVGDGSQMKFDDNWSIYDTLTQRGQTLDARNKHKSQSLRDVFANSEVKSFSEFTDPDQNSGKDFSVRNWKEVMDRSKGDVKNTAEETLDEGNLAYTGLFTKRSNSSPSLGSLSDTKYSSQIEKPLFSTKSSRAIKKQKSSKELEDIEELTSNTSSESPSRLTSTGRNSTLPSRRLHGMMQSFDSIYPGQPSLDGRHYQKKAEPRKHSLPSKCSSGLLSPVQRRKQRAQQGGKR